MYLSGIFFFFLFKKVAQPSSIFKINVESFFDCLIECSASTRCLSTNVNTTSDAQGMLECELLDIDKYQHEKNFTKVMGIDHYVLPVRGSVILRYVVINFETRYFYVVSRHDRWLPVSSVR